MTAVYPAGTEMLCPFCDRVLYRLTRDIERTQIIAANAVEAVDPEVAPPTKGQEIACPEHGPIHFNLRITRLGWDTFWLIERPGRESPEYWVEGANWTSDAWKATRFTEEKDAERELRSWNLTPTILDAKVVSHGFARG